VSARDDRYFAEARPRFLAAQERGWPGRAASLFFAGIWLVFLSDAFTLAWQNRQNVEGDGGLIVLVLFVVLYLLHFAHMRRTVWGPAATAGPHWYVSRLGLAYWVGLAVLAVLAVVTLGQEGASTWVFLAVSGLWTFRVTVGLAIGAVLVGVYEYLSFHLEGWNHNASVSMSIVLAMAAVTGGMLASQRQRALGEAREENARLAIQEERNRMARDVHDILGHSLTVITVKAELAARLLDVDPERARAEVADLETLARDALADVRQAVAGFRDISLPGELAHARSTLAAAGIVAELPTATDAVQGELREVCAWTLREGITNVIRHSGATACRVTLQPGGITISDNGTGPAPGVPGTGLLGLRERAEAVGARLETRALEPHGFELAVVAVRPPGRTSSAGTPEAPERVDA
jgi:two-component system sensor histidine kinase DesK